ncbi:MAG TPA: TonB-dependent receptor [Rariglobus sp.]|nr:TonB-dependent receptor [Rariglobus sp.]
MSQPAAVTAYSGDFLTDNGISGYGDLAPLVPGLFVSTQAVDSAGLNLRGLTTDTSDPNVQPRVSVFQDGVSISNIHGANVALFDMDNVQVFKGPQPTVFGRGVEGGALSLTSNPARNETSGALTAGGGDYGQRAAEGYINTPVITDKLFARVAFSFDQSDGFIKNLADGSTLQGVDTAALRTSLRWQPDTTTTADLIFSYQHDTPPGIDFKSAIIAPSGGDTNPYTAANLTRGSALGIDRTIVGLTGIVRHELNDAWTLVSTSAWRQVDSRDEFDADGSALYLLEPGEAFHEHQLSQEVRFSYDRGDRLTAMIGGGVSGEKDAQNVTLRTDEGVLWNFLTGFPAGTLPGAISRYSEHYTKDASTTSFDLFGRSDYKLTPKLTLGAGLRVTQEHITSGYQSFNDMTGHLPPGILPGTGGGNDFFKPTAGRLETDTDATSWSGKVDARYAFTPNFTTYAAVSRGRHAPVLGFDQMTLQPFELHEETLWNYEAGIKGSTPGQRLRYELSVFQYYFDHFQTLRTVPAGTQSVDGGRASGQGFEGTVQGAVTRELTLFGSYGFTDARFAALDDSGQPQAYAGNTFRLAARHTLSFGGTLTLPATDHGAIFITPVMTYQSAHYFEDNNAQNGGVLRQGGFTLVNLRIGYRPRSNRWEFAGFVNNLFNKHYLIDAGNIGGGFGDPTNVPGAPRMVGAKATVRF